MEIKEIYAGTGTKRIIVFILLFTALLFFTCSQILSSEAQNPAKPDETVLHTPTHIYATAAFLVWSMPQSENFAAYKIYYDTRPGVSETSRFGACIDFKNDTSCLLDSLDENTTYWVKVFVYNSTSFSESNEISFTTIPCTCGSFTGERQDGMILIPAGCFVGKDSAVAVLSNDFYMDTTEVTIAEWNRVMTTASIIDTTMISSTIWKYVLNIDTSTSLKPKTQISWYQMIVYCNEKSKMENRDTCYTFTSIVIDTLSFKISEIKDVVCDFSRNGFRLPTEDEWEYACRGGKGEEFFWGKDGNTLLVYPYTADYPETSEDTMEISSYVWWDYNNDPSGSKEVAQKTPNTWQLYDIIGNVEEVVWDVLSNVERVKRRIDYPGEQLGPQTIRSAIVRGGSYQTSKAYLLTVWWRGSSIKFDNVVNNRVGFRTVRTKLP